MDPSRRPGAGPDGYASLKSHPFFKGIDWINLRAGTPPKLALDPRVIHSFFFLFIFFFWFFPCSQLMYLVELFNYEEKRKGKSQ